MSVHTSGQHQGNEVLTGSVIVMTAFVVAAITFSQIFDSFFSQVQAAVSANTGWFLIFSMNAILIFCVYLAASRFSHIRLGGPDATPEFSTAGWLAMLFAAGMGIGLVFYSVAEPLQHFASFEPYMENHPAQAATLAMRMTFLHWGFHPWAVYSLVGLALAYFHFNRHHPLTFAAPFEDLAGRSIGWKGHAINILAVLATAFGVATSLGLGVAQANAGLDYLLGIGQGLFIQFIVLALVMAVSIVSIARGLDEGVRWLSEINLVGALLLLLFILLLGPTVFILKALGENIGGYLNEILVLSTWNETYTGTNWQDKWTIFYWGWWISWSPFVGLFIARVSRGRTVREFLTGVMLVPATFNFFWMTVFGSSALDIQLFGDGELVKAVTEDPSVSLFAFLEHYPLATITSVVAVFIVLLFFITSANSGAVVVATITSNGYDPSLRQRIFWALGIGGVAAALMFGGGLTALQAATITTGLPFAIILLFIAYALIKALQRQYPAPKTHERSAKK